MAMSSILSSRKRPSETVEDEDEMSSASTSGKRARHAHDVSRRRSSSGGNGEHDPDLYQPGSIVRVKLTNFVTYTSAEFHLGPSLNMIIGPNGTGKSTLVCAICLGLGWSPQYLGRAKDIGEFVKHGSAEAEIEIELAASEMQHKNPVIRRRIQKQGSKTAFYIDGQPKAQKDVKALAESFSIQINNLCQFLPQDRVVEFARMDSVEMLGETLRAAASGQMVRWHNDLKQLRYEQKEAEVQQQNEQQHLRALQAKQSVERAEVDRYNQRQDLVAKQMALDKCRPFIEYRDLKQQCQLLKDQVNSETVKLEQIQNDAEPARRAEENMQGYRDQIEGVARSRKRQYEAMRSSVEVASSKIDQDQQSLGMHTAEIDTEKQAEKKRKSDIRRLENELISLRHQQDNNIVEYDPTTYTARFAEIRAKKNAADRKVAALKQELSRMHQELMQKREDLTTKSRRKEHLSSKSGQQDNLLSKRFPDTFRGWTWLKENLGKLSLNDKVYGPPIIECSVPDPKHADVIETLLARGDLMAITCTNKEDAQVIQNKLVGKKEAGGLGLHQIAIRTIPNPRSFYKSPLSTDKLAKLGFEGWVSDLVEGPDAVLAMLCEMTKIHRTAFASMSMTDEQYRKVEEYNKSQERNPSTQIQKWAAGGEVYQTTGRSEYGISSTNVKQLRKAQWFTGQPTATADVQQVEEAMRDIEIEISSAKEAHKVKADEYRLAQGQQEEVDAERMRLQSEQDDIKKAYAAWQRLPDRLAMKQQDLEDIKTLSRDSKNRLKSIQSKHENAALALARYTIEYANQVAQLHSLHESFLEAEIRLIEANSELKGFQNDNREIIEAIERQSRELERLKVEKSHKNAARRQLRQQAHDIEYSCSEFEKAIIAEYTTLGLEELDNEISAVASRLELMEDGNPRALRAYQDRERDMEKIQRTISETQDKLEQNQMQIKHIRDQWEPELDRIVATISDGFAHNFEMIGCAGHVSVKKEEDFDKWAVQIEVRFRENEQMAILDAHRQSGGERAVSTIFYLMALQGLARSPFRVVDEINQGMDPRNERMVHERMVDIACAERTSQYFLVTPKLLNNLKFHPKMKVHCIASGEYMPDQRTNLDFQSLAKLALRVRKGIVA